ncbi:hypothetical protein [Dyadobacter helix]|uniref:hypothetical protein n=1 Tax=Dyadobacter helix TaxID=2822344 RepID=UPI001BFCA4F9|nr:hypothetical protein [Dyadobacter sp. CECT 9275]
MTHFIVTNTGFSATDPGLFLTEKYAFKNTTYCLLKAAPRYQLCPGLQPQLAHSRRDSGRYPPSAFKGK